MTETEILFKMETLGAAEFSEFLKTSFKNGLISFELYKEFK